MRRYLVPVVIGALLITFWISSDAQEIAAGVAIYLFGMLMLENGFRLLTGGALERILERATHSTLRSIVFGMLATTFVQSSSLVSVITISFLSAGLISLAGGIGVIFGANIGTTTGAWLVAGLGLKVDIASFAMPMIALSIVLVLQKSNLLRGIGYAFGGLGFLFLGIHHMKEGFDAFKEQIDLSRYALPGIAGLVVYSVLGAIATLVVQSSHATMVIILTALAAGQITYDNALALAIGANVGTTITAIVGSLGANFQGKRLAMAHLIFNAVTAGVALIFIAPLRAMVDLVTEVVGIAPADYAMKLAVFHTIFNVLGVILLAPLMGQLIGYLERSIKEPVADISRPRYLNAAVDEFPETLESALRNEVQHLYQNAVGLILHGLNLHRDQVYETDSVERTIRGSRTRIDIDMEDGYQRRVKTLYSAIVDFTSRSGVQRLSPEMADRIYELRDVAADIVQAVKSVKHLRKNVLRYTTKPQGAVTRLYDGLRAEIARILIEVHRLKLATPEERTVLWLDQERVMVEEDKRLANRHVDELIRNGELKPDQASSFLNDSGYAYAAMRDLIEAARKYYGERSNAAAEVERILELDVGEVSTDDLPRGAIGKDQGDTANSKFTVKKKM